MREPVRSFGRPVEPEPEPELAAPPVLFPPIQLPVQFVADPRSLEILGAQIAGVIGRAIYDAIAAAVDTAGPHPQQDDGAQDRDAGIYPCAEPSSAQIADLTR